MNRFSRENDIMARENEQLPSKENCPWTKKSNVPVGLSSMKNQLDSGNAKSVRKSISEYEEKWCRFLKKA